LISRDTLATLNASESIGATITKGIDLKIKGNNLHIPDEVINVENSGTTLRFLTAMCSLLPEGYTILTGDESIRSRPMQPLISALSKLGTECYSSRQNGLPPIIVKGGGLRGGKPYLGETYHHNLSQHFL